ncbi:MAG: CPBP family intramembrane metalloprotease [Oscillospiraceae bacterium]|jgi:membrane protease YdiL (CAAX protease family)|nr:CPBP family intramembrane metalloprotease [Oscillospiraceae bacterium]
MNRRQLPEFTSHLERREMRAVMVYLIVHACILPWVINYMTTQGTVSPTEGNFLYYALGAGFMFATCMPFFRRDFDPLCDRPLYCMLEVLTGYFSMVCVNFCVSALLLNLLPGSENPNNAAVTELVFEDFGAMKASLMFFTPITEEMLFRAGIFGMMRELKGRRAAYIVSVALFSFYHVWSYAVIDPIYWVYLLQYIPASFLLARCYERTNSIWCPIFFHMMVNAVAVNTLDMIQAMM